jgi:hypothetical protein
VRNQRRVAAEAGERSRRWHRSGRHWRCVAVRQRWDVYYNDKSDFAIAEVVVWPRGLTDDEMRGVSEHINNRLG